MLRIAASFFTPTRGFPNELGEYDDEPENMSSLIGEFAQAGLLNLTGGCCGTTPDHIRAIARSVENVTPREAPQISRHCRLSGLETLTITPELNFVNVGERTNVTGSARFPKIDPGG